MDFSKCSFSSGANFDSAIFDQRANFTGAKFRLAAIFDNVEFNYTAIFNDCEFSSLASFRGAKLGDKGSNTTTISFRTTKFHDQAWFDTAIFGGSCDFGKCEFFSAGFKLTRFYGSSCFSGIKCENSIDFSSADFASSFDLSFAKVGRILDLQELYARGGLDLAEARIGELNCGSMKTLAILTLEGLEVKGRADFTKVDFLGDSNFVHSKFHKSLSLRNAIFKRVPELTCIEFSEPPVLDGVAIPFVKEYRAVNEYRRLKSMAKQSSDHQNMLKFFAYETRAKLYGKTVTPFGKLVIAGYWLFSDFGQSLWKPVIALMLFMSIAFCVNLRLIEPEPGKCEKHSYAHTSQVIAYTVSSSLAVLPMEKTQSKKIRDCLFGDEPYTLLHSVWKLAHLVPSTLFLFFFGLAVRNRFKIF